MVKVLARYDNEWGFSAYCAVVIALDKAHISMLFVDRAFQGHGIARALINRALAICRREKPELASVTVNSSPYAVPIYERVGFHVTAPEQVVHGIRFTAMVLDILNSSCGANAD